ncbi:MAG: hypothetical protein HZA00_09375, partial [Nitrospinae bacterium]|nr:hypothetical protein [Nitrospinota bacterium]
MKKVFIIINIILSSLILFEGWQFFRVWSAESALSFIKMGTTGLNKPSTVTPVTRRAIGKIEKKENIPREGMVLSGVTFEGEGDKLLPLRESFAGAIEKNLFHPQRREGAEEIKIESPSSSLSKPKPKPIIMEGLVIIGNYKAAVIKDTAPQVKGG